MAIRATCSGFPYLILLFASLYVVLSSLPVRHLIMLNSSSTHHTMLRLGRCCIDKLRLSQPSLPHPRCRESSVEKVCWPRDSVKCASKSFHTSRQCREEVEDKSFRSQMFNSTRQRLERERREQERFARYSAPTAAGWFAPLIASKNHRHYSPQIDGLINLRH